MGTDREVALQSGAADLAVRLRAQSRGPRGTFAIYDLGLMLHRWLLEHPQTRAADAMAFFGIERTRGLRAMRIAELPEEILNAWRDRRAITVRGGAQVAAVVARGGAPARRLSAQAAAFAREGGMLRPEPLLLSAATDGMRRWDTLECRLQTADRTLVGRLRYSRLSNAFLDLRLMAQAPVELRDDIMALLQRHGLLK